MNINQKFTFVKMIFKRLNMTPEKQERYRGFLRESWALTWPMLIIMFFDFCMNLTDVFVAGKIGKEVQASVGLANQIYYILTVVITAVTIGTIAVLSRIYSGANRERDLPSAVYTAVVFAGACASVVTVVAVFAAPRILGLLDIDPEVKQKATLFIKLYCTGLFFHLMMMHFNGIMRACKKIRFTMKVLMLSSTLNIILNILFVFYTPLGEKGIPLSTAASWFVAFCLTVPAVLKLMKIRKDTIREFSPTIAKKIFSISWPSGIISFSWQLSSMTMFTIVGALPVHSVETMAAMTAGLRIESMIYMPAFAFNMANAVLVGSLLGEKKPEDAYATGLVTVGVGVTAITLITVIVIAAAGPIAHLLASKDADGNIDPVVVKEIIKYLHIVMISEPFMAANLMFSGALSGAGDTRALMRYSLFSLWVLRIPAAYIFGLVLGFGATAIWWAMNITFFSQATLSGRRYLSRKWIK